MTLKLITFDLGANFALAHNGHEDVIVVEHQVFTGPRAHRAKATMNYLNARLEECDDAGITFDAAVYERPFVRGRDATRCLWGIAGIIEAVCTDWGMAVVDAENKQVKKWAKGHGGVKDGMLEAARALGYIGDNEHEADTFCLLKYSEQFVTSAPRKIK